MLEPRPQRPQRPANRLLRWLDELTMEAWSAGMALNLAEGFRKGMGPGSLLGPYTSEIIRIQYGHLALVTSRLVDTHSRSASLPRLLQELAKNSPNKLSGDLADGGGALLSVAESASLQERARAASEGLDKNGAVQEVREYRDTILAHLDYEYFITKSRGDAPSIGPVLLALGHCQEVINELHGHIFGADFSFQSGGCDDLLLAAEHLRLGIDYELALCDSMGDLPHTPVEDPLAQWPPKRALTELAGFYRGAAAKRT